MNFSRAEDKQSSMAHNGAQGQRYTNDASLQCIEKLWRPNYDFTIVCI